MGHKISLLVLYVPCGFHKESFFVVQMHVVEQFELDIESLGYDPMIQEFIRPSQNSDSFEADGRLKYSIIITLAEIMKSYYMEWQ